MKKLSIVLIIAGVLIAAYPLLDKAYSFYLQTRLIMEWEVDLGEDYAEVASDDYIQLQSILEEGLNEESGIPDAESDQDPYDNRDNEISEEPDERVAPSSEETSEPAPAAPVKAPSMKTLGRITIEKINLQIPIVEGTSKANLRVGAGQIVGTSKLGNVGNAALAAHRSHTYGRMFNRLDEMEIGDKILVETKDGTYEYTVYKKHVVEPTDLTVLNRNNKDRVLTLVTCTPIYTATHRLIVHAVIKE